MTLFVQFKEERKMDQFNRDRVTRNRAILNIDGKRKMYLHAGDADESTEQSSLEQSELTQQLLDLSNEVTNMSVASDVHGK